jgi:histidyl-tRNA synthetase
MKAADRINAAFTLILGENEVQAQEATVRDMRSGQQTAVPLAELTAWLTERL